MDPAQCGYAVMAIYLDRFGKAGRRNVCCLPGGALVPDADSISFLVWQLEEAFGPAALLDDMEICGVPLEEADAFFRQLPDAADAVERVIRANVHGRENQAPLLGADEPLWCDLTATSASMDYVMSLYADRYRRMKGEKT
ncbi:MAG: hypothetical protein PUC71_02270 [Oscillospiraceae bacterium]|nr:hypothetical protein [Oscillospiraceae bacterium]